MNTCIHFIPSLGPGGTEAFLVSYYKRYPVNTRNHYIITLLSYPDCYSQTLNNLGVQTLCLFQVFHYLRLFSLIRRSLSTRTVLLGWLYLGNALSSFYHILLAIFLRPPSLHVWNIRNGFDLARYGLITHLSFASNPLLSLLPGKIIFNSTYSCLAHHRFFPSAKSLVVPNGTDSQLYTYSCKYRNFHRSRLGIPHDQFIIGTVGRNRPEKGFHLLIQVFSLVLEVFPLIKLLIIGDGHVSATYSSHPSIIVSPHTSSVHELYPVFDLYVQTSLTESYPNSLAEAMSSSLPCLSTNVGDSQTLLNDPDQLCPSFHPADLAASLLRLLSMTSNQLSDKGSRNSFRIHSTFDRSTTLNFYNQILSNF